MDKNQILGFILIFAVVVGWSVYTTPSVEEIERQQFVQDSIAQVERQQTLQDSLEQVSIEQRSAGTVDAVTDSIVQATKQATLGPFATAAGPAQTYTLTNGLATYTFSGKGGFITSATMQEHVTTVDKITGEEQEAQTLSFMTDEDNQFGLLLDVPGAYNGKVSTGDLVFSGAVAGNSLTLRAPAANGGAIVYKYTLRPDSYIIDFDVQLDNVGTLITNNGDIDLHWVNHLEKLERSVTFEQRYSTVYFKEADDDVDYCSCTGNDVEDLRDKRIDWVSHSNQFFNTSIISLDQPFTSGEFETVVPDKDDEDAPLKTLKTTIGLPLSAGAGKYSMAIYAGPNDYRRLGKFDKELGQIIPYGRSIFGTINRYVIRPVFEFLSRFIGSKGVVIILLILMIKVLLYPLMYKMLHSQAKMQALKPEIAHLKDKHKDDAQKVQMETMKIYGSYGVSPLGGCLPMIVQMPIWYALFRFFPASITFRQEPFLWASDLSSYDKWIELGFTVPLGFGSHISLFTLLWAVSMLAYTFYNTKHMDLSANPAMKYVQYLMPIMFVGFFNNYASGLTVYMLFSNLINIVQTIGTKKFVFNEEKILAELKEKQKTRKSKGGGFGAKLEKIMQEQQKQAAQQKGKKNRKK